MEKIKVRGLVLVVFSLFLGNYGETLGHTGNMLVNDVEAVGLIGLSSGIALFYYDNYDHFNKNN